MFKLKQTKDDSSLAGSSYSADPRVVLTVCSLSGFLLSCSDGDKSKHEDWAAEARPATNVQAAVVQADAQVGQLIGQIRSIKDWIHPTDQEIRRLKVSSAQLTLIGEPAIPALIELMRDNQGDDWMASRAASRILVEIGKVAVPHLQRLIEEEEFKYSPDVEIAIQTLGEIGPDAAVAIPAIEKVHEQSRNEGAPDFFSGPL